MNKKVNISEVEHFSKELGEASADIRSQLEKVKENIEDISNMNSFSGKAAKEAKKYFNEMHVTILESFQGLFTDLEENLEQHIKTFESNVDHGDSTVIDRNYLLDTEEEINEEFADLKKQDKIIQDTIKEISDIVSVKPPSFSDVEAQQNETIEVAKELAEDLDSFTSNSEKSRCKVDYESNSGGNGSIQNT